MKRLARSLTFAALFALLGQFPSGPAAAQETKPETPTKAVDPSGTWRWESERNGTTTKNQLKLEINDKQEVTATYYGLMDGLKSDTGKMQGDKLSLEFNVKRDDLAFTAKYNATLKDDRASGTLSLTSDRGSTDIPWEAERTVELSDVLGTWQIRIEVDGNVIEPSVKIESAGQEYKGTYRSPRLSELAVQKLRVEKNQLMFTVATDINGTAIKVDFQGRPYGSRLKGKVAYDLGGNSGEADFSAKRANDP